MSLGTLLSMLALGTAAAVAQTVADGRIAGRITTTLDEILPGVTVRISGNGLSRVVITDNDGRFVLGSLPLASYTIRTELAGFRSQSGEIVLTPAQPRAYLAWSLGLGCLVADITVIEGLRDLARRVDDVVHVRVVSSDGPVLWSVRPECDGEVLQEHSVDVLGRASRPGRSGTAPKRLQVFTSRRRFPMGLEPGKEYLAFLWPPGRFAWPGSHPAVSGAFPVDSGRVFTKATRESDSDAAELDGTRVSDALDMIARWARERPR